MHHQSAKGFCWIYKKAILYTPDGNSSVIHYTNGTEPFGCIVDTSDSIPVYVWDLVGNHIHIPLNLRRDDTDSIYRSGEVDTSEGIIRWECIFGKFTPEMCPSPKTMRRRSGCTFPPLWPLLLVLLVTLLAQKSMYYKKRV